MSNFGGYPGMTHEHFLWALALAPGPTEEPESFTEIHRRWPEQPPGYDIMLELALDILVELGHLGVSYREEYNSANPDGITVALYQCRPEAADQRQEAINHLEAPTQ